MSEYAAPAGSGDAMHRLVSELYPICRSITGDGFRQSLALLGNIIPMEVTEVPSGTPAFDWTVPNEWNIREAWIADSSGRRIVDLQDSTLHVVSYSTPVRARLRLSQLRPHLHTLPDQPHLIPYRTSYYKEDWGFCLSHSLLESLKDGEYEVCIDSSLKAGSLTYGECVLPGAIADEILISVHSCHPSLANDNLSGMAVGAFLARHLADKPRRHTIRFLFIPGTIGSITWLARNQDDIGRVRHGLVLSCLGDRGTPTYKRSRRGTTLIDRAAAHVLHQSGAGEIVEFVPYGYDERQYCSPGFDLAVGCLTRTPNGKFPEYHTSADNLDFVAPESLEDSLNKVLAILEILEHDRTYLNLNPMCEPRLGARGLYRNTGGSTPKDFEMCLLWVLNFSDGSHSLLDIAERASMPFATVRGAADALRKASLVRVIDREVSSRNRSDTPAPRSAASRARSAAC